MKTKFLLVFCLLIGLNIAAQTNGINYKAILKDTNGNVVANSTIDVIININEDATSIYSEFHTIATDSNGLFIINIGEGTAAAGDDFTTIDWTTNNHFLGLQVGIEGGSFIDLGTTAFKAVPYAYNAKTAENVTGLENIFEDNIGGWRLVGKDPVNYGNIGFAAIDLSFSLEATDTNGATGGFAFSSGFNTVANGNFSSSFGNSTEAQGENSVVFGQYSFAASSATNALVAGYNSGAYGNSSTAIGRSLRADSYNNFAIGRYNVGGGSPTSWVPTDPLFEIGMGINDANKANALTVLKNGTIIAPGFLLSNITDPKALITKEYADNNIVATGLEEITEGSAPGWRLQGRNAANYTNVGVDAVDFSTSLVASETNGAGGDFSFASGINTKAIGGSSASFGFDTASSGNISSSFGVGTNAESYAETVIGTYDTNYTPANESAYNSSDRVFVVGNGVSNEARSNALVVRKNGMILAPSLEMSEITTSKSLVTREYALANFTQSGLELVVEGPNVGWRLEEENDDFHGLIGDGAVDLSVQSAVNFTMGAVGETSFASGFRTTASGPNSVAMNTNTVASGAKSFASGGSTDATGFTSTAMGSASVASGSYSFALGKDVNALSYSEFVIGQYNTNYTPNATGSYNLADRLFVVGNGNNTNDRKNALTLLKNGRLGIQTETPDAKLHITGGADASDANGTGYVVIGDLDAQNMVIDQNEIIARLNGASSTLFLNQTGGDVWAGGALVHSSDRRLKRNIKELEYGLEEVLKLEPKQYFWINKVGQKQESLGVIAQEIQDIIPNVVHEKDDAQKTLSVSYTELIPVLINAIKEQQQIINNQDNTIKGLTGEVTALKSLEQRMQELEALVKVTNK